MISVEKIVEVPPDVEVVLNGRKVTVRGPKGELTRDFSYAPAEISLKENKLKLEMRWPRRKESAVIGTVKSHIESMIQGVREGFTYKLKMVFAHFPVSVKTDRDLIIIENFSGERSPRTAKIVGSSKVSIEGDDIIIRGIDLGEVSQTAANIEQATRVHGKDLRVFLDGIYIYEKGIGM